MTALENLKKYTTVVADTGDIDAIAKHQPQDATTNPSLLFKAAQMDEYQDLVDDAVAKGKLEGGDDASRMNAVIDHLSVNFGRKILDIIPGRVSTEVDAGLSFDIDATIQKAHHLIKLYQDAGIDSERILIKIASTWEGIEAARQLEQEGIHCNLTLLFGFGQAVACAEAKVTLISPFVGRIYDWFKAKNNVDHIAIEDDPGVASVTRIYNYYKKFGYKTQVMGASFRTADQVIALCGSDLLTISPGLLSELGEQDDDVPQRLSITSAEASTDSKVAISESKFRWFLNEDAMATEKLAEGIRGFASDLNKLRDYLAERVL